MYKSYSMELAGRTLTVDIGRVCAQANGAALLKYGETTVLSTATASDKPRDGIDFFPLFDYNYFLRPKRSIKERYLSISIFFKYDNNPRL